MGFPRCCLLFVGISVLSSVAAFAQQYSVTDLGTLATNSLGADANAVNSVGQVVGNSDVNGQPHAFLWSEGAMTDLGLLPGMAACVPTAINDSGQVVGRCTDFHTSRAFVWTQETGMNALNIPSSSVAQGINTQGDIVGWFQCSDNADCAFVYHASGALDSLDIGTAAAINDAGDAVGWSADAAARPLLWDAQGEHDLGTLGDPGGFAEAEAISADGLIVGRSSTGASGEIHAVCWTPYGLSNLGTLGGISAEAFAISGALIVGWSSTASGDTHAFVYDNNGPGYPVDLNDLIPADSGWSSSARAGSMATARSSAPET